MIPAGDFFTNLAASLVYDLLKAGGSRLQAFVQGTPEEQALRRCYEAASRGMLEEVASDLDAIQRTQVETVVRQFVSNPEVAGALLDLALAGADLPDLSALRAAFDALEFDRATLPVDFDRALTAFQRGLSAALIAHAAHADSPLFHRVNLGRVLAIQALLQQQRYALEAVQKQLALLDRGGQTVYNIIIQQATGLAIGDGARVGGPFLPKYALSWPRSWTPCARCAAHRPPTSPTPPHSCTPTWTG